MKKTIGLIILCALCVRCDDGDIIVTSFDFDNQNLQACGGPGDYVFFKTNTNTQEKHH